MVHVGAGHREAMKTAGDPQGRRKMGNVPPIALPQNLSWMLPGSQGRLGLSCQHKAENTLNTHLHHYSETGTHRHTHGSLLALKGPICDR